VAGLCEHGNKPSDSILNGEFIYHLSDYKIFRRKSAAWNSYIAVDRTQAYCKWHVGNEAWFVNTRITQVLRHVSEL
jgi:hypothetical protein